MSDIFQDPKVGDEVALYRNMRGTPVKIIIERVLPSQIIIGAARFKRRDGYQIGTYMPSHIVPWTPEIDAMIATEAELAAHEERAAALYVRLSRTVERVKFDGRGATRTWDDSRVRRLEAFVVDFEARADDLVGPDSRKAVAP